VLGCGGYDRIQVGFCGAGA